MDGYHCISHKQFGRVCVCFDHFGRKCHNDGHCPDNMVRDISIKRGVHNFSCLTPCVSALEKKQDQVHSFLHQVCDTERHVCFNPPRCTADHDCFGGKECVALR